VSLNWIITLGYLCHHHHHHHLHHHEISGAPITIRPHKVNIDTLNRITNGLLFVLYNYIEVIVNDLTLTCFTLTSTCT